LNPLIINAVPIFGWKMALHGDLGIIDLLLVNLVCLQASCSTDRGLSQCQSTVVGRDL
jgi:hypothetical protein